MISTRTKKGQPETALRRILNAAPQDLWLDTIRRTRLPQHDSLVHWMLNQVKCDFAVAAHAFYRSSPDQHIDNARPLPTRPEPSELFAQVLLNWDKGYYRTHDLRTDIRDADPRMIRRVNQKLIARPRGALPFKVPSKLLELDGGRPVSLPSHLRPDDAAHLWQIYNDLGLRVPPSPPGMARRVAKARGLIDRIGFRTRRS